MNEDDGETCSVFRDALDVCVSVVGFQVDEK